MVETMVSTPYFVIVDNKIGRQNVREQDSRNASSKRMTQQERIRFENARQRRPGKIFREGREEKKRN